MIFEKVLRPIFVVVLLISLLALNVACQGQAPNPTAQPKAAAPAAKAESQPAAAKTESHPIAAATKTEAEPAKPAGADVAAAKKEGKLVVYGSIDEVALVGLLNLFHERYPEIDTTTYLRAGAAKLHPKILAETQAGGGDIDVVVYTDMSYVIDLQEKGLWSSYTSPESKNYDKKYYSNPEGLWLAYRGQPIMVCWNPKVVPDAEAPKEYKDLLDPKWKGQIGFELPAGGSQFIQWYLLRQVLGDQYWEKLAENKPRGFDSGAQLMEKTYSGELRLAGQGTASRYVAQYIRKNLPMKAMWTKEGIPMQYDAVGMLKSAKHPNAAKLFVDFLLSKEVQAKFVTGEMASYSLHADVAEPPELPPLKSLNPLWLSDWKDVVEAGKIFPEKFGPVVGVKP